MTTFWLCTPSFIAILIYTPLIISVYFIHYGYVILIGCDTFSTLSEMIFPHRVSLKT